MSAVIIIVSFAIVILTSILSHGDRWWMSGAVLVAAVFWFAGASLGRRP
ncbi:hypothetical protein [Azospirillum brasilense]|nr:hypothetical protein [Azospirillum brasilense]UKJ76633.1 hypothetical protein H1Q64_23135 [Azospirillum brasilense]